MTSFHQPCAFLAGVLTGVEFHVFPRVSVCFLLEFDLLLALRILDCASLLCGLLSDKLRCLRLKLELLAFGILRKYCESLSMFSSFVSAGVEFHVRASHLVCFLRMVSLLKLERRLADKI